MRGYPNPAPGHCTIEFRAPTDGPIALFIIGVNRRVVRTILESQLPAGDYCRTWDGRDDGGAEVPAGVYLTRVETMGGVKTGKVTVAR